MYNDPRCRDIGFFLQGDETMSNTLPQPVEATEAEAQKTLNELFNEMQLLNKLTEQDQSVIEQLKVETDLLRVETRAILARLEATF